MRRKLGALLGALCLAGLLLAGCGQEGPPDPAGKKYIYEESGFGGSFYITVQTDGTFSYYEGDMSSYIGTGGWTLEEGVLTLTDKNFPFVNRFRVEKDGLVFLSEGSTNFMHVDVADGQRFEAD